MESKPSYDQGHLLVAAARVLRHRNQRPPTTDEIAKLIGSSSEFAGLLVRSLERLGIVRTVTSAFETRVEITDHIALEELPAEAEGSAFESEVEEFHQRYTQKQEQLERIFSEGEHEKERKKKMKSMEDELRGFKGKKIVDDSGLFKDDDSS
jgi:hypothetical protein